MSVSDTLLSAIYAEETGEAMALLLTLDHATLESPVRVTDATTETLADGARGLVSRGYAFQWYPFELELPRDEQGKPLTAKLRIDNVGRRLVQHLRPVTSPPAVTIEAVLDSDPDTVEVRFDHFRLAQASWSTLVVEGDLVQRGPEAEPYPAPTFTPAGFPGLFD